MQNKWHINGKVYNTANEAAEAEGVSHTTISNWVNGFSDHGRHYTPKKGCKCLKSISDKMIAKMTHPLWVWNLSLKNPHKPSVLAGLLSITRQTLDRWLSGQVPSKKYDGILFVVCGEAVTREDW